MKPHLWLIRLVGVIVPRQLRPDWRLEWDAELRYREGLSTQLELSDARLLLQQAQNQRAVAARTVQLARVRLGLLPDLPLSAASAATAAASQGAPAAQRAPATTPAAAATPAASTRTGSQRE